MESSGSAERYCGGDVEENVEIMRRVYEAFNDGEIAWGEPSAKVHSSIQTLSSPEHA